MLAVVEDEQQLQIAKTVLQRLEYRAIRFLRNTRGEGDGARDECRIGDGCKFGEPNAVAKATDECGRDFDGGAALSDAAGSDKRYEALLGEQRLNARNEIGSAEKFGGGRGRLSRAAASGGIGVASWVRCPPGPRRRPRSAAPRSSPCCSGLRFKTSTSSANVSRCGARRVPRS